MNECVLNLCDIYNFVVCQGKTQLHVDLSLLEEFIQIHQLLRTFKEDDDSPKEVFLQLQQFIAKEEEGFGPRKFTRLIQGITTVVIQHTLNRLREGKVDKAVLILTYFQRSCGRYFKFHIQIAVLLTYTLAHIRHHSLVIAQNYTRSIAQIIKKIDRFGVNETSSIVSKLQLLADILAGVVQLQLGNTSKAKCLLSDTISRVTAMIHLQQSKEKKLNLTSASFFVLSTYFMSRICQEQGNHDISAYNLTQCLQFAAHHLSDPQPLVAHFTSNSQFLIRKTVKLSRIENKIERIKTLHSLNHLLPPTKTTIPKSLHNVKENVPAQEIVSKQLSKLFVLDEKSEVKLKKRTLRILRNQRVDKDKKISNFKEGMEQFARQKEQIKEQYQNQMFESQLQQIENEKKELQKQIKKNLWDVVGSLKPTHKIECYLNAFRTAIYYETNNKFSKFLCTQVSLKGQLKLFSYFRKFKSQLIRQQIKTLPIRGVLHQLQFLRHKLTKIPTIRLYRIERGEGIDDQREVTEQIYEGLKTEPISYYFQDINSRLIPLADYLSSLPVCLIIRLKLLAMKIRKRYLKQRNQLNFRKQIVNITFNTYHTELIYTIFVTTKRVTNELFSHVIQRIDCTKHMNRDYNLVLHKLIINNEAQLYEHELAEIITEEILNKKKKHIPLIMRIQNLFRFKLSHKVLENRKQTMIVTTVMINRSIFTLTQNGNNRHFYIENIDKEYPKVVLKFVDFSNIAFINKLRPELSSFDDCSQQLGVIQKFFKLRQFANKLIKKSKEVKLDTKFETKFKKSLCFAKIMKNFLYKGKYFEGKVMYMLTVKDFQQFPRPYLLRVFTIQHQTLFSVDFQKIIFNTEKIYFECNLQKINQLIDIQGLKSAQIIGEGPGQLIPKSKRSNSKSTIVSNFTFGSGEQFLKEIPRSRMNSRLLLNRQSHLVGRNKKNSINFKMRHKSALKQKDILLIKKWIEDSKEDSSISESSESNSS